MSRIEGNAQSGLYVLTGAEVAAVSGGDSDVARNAPVAISDPWSVFFSSAPQLNQNPSCLP